MSLYPQKVTRPLGHFLTYYRFKIDVSDAKNEHKIHNKRNPVKIFKNTLKISEVW